MLTPDLSVQGSKFGASVTLGAVAQCPVGDTDEVIRLITCDKYSRLFTRRAYGDQVANVLTVFIKYFYCI